MSKHDKTALFAARALGWVNALMAAGMALLGGVFVLGSLGCGEMVDSDYAIMSLEDSLALEKIFQANGLKVSAIPVATEVGAEGRVIKLDLNDKRVTTLPPEIGVLVGLETLDLGRNALKSVPKEMEKLVSLTALFLHENALDSLPDGLRFESIRTADLHGNRLASLPGNFDVTSVRRLDLSGNLLTSLPPDFGFLHNLEFLNLEGNRLGSLDVDFSRMKSLYSLNLSRNGLKSLPPSLADLEPSFVDVGHNRLCFQKEATPDSATTRMIAWLDALDRDWRDTQACP
jgi:hypothetical protein